MPDTSNLSANNVRCLPGYSIWRHENGWDRLDEAAFELQDLAGSTSSNVYWLEAAAGSFGGKLVHFDGNVVSIRMRPTLDPRPHFFVKGHNPVHADSIVWHEYPPEGEPIPLPLHADADPLIQLGPATEPQLLYYDKLALENPTRMLGTIDGWTDVTDPGPLDDVLGGVWPHIVQRTGNDVARFDGAEWSTVTITPPGDLVAERMVLMDDVSTIGVITSTHVGTCDAFAGDTP